MAKITGHHHISMMMKDAKTNHHFYTEIMGIRFVKKTVNQDNPTMYHLFYGDEQGSPGFDITFFEMPMIGQTYRGTNAIHQLGLLVPSEESLKYWQDRLKNFEITVSEIETYLGRPTIFFQDPDGLNLAITVSDTEAPFFKVWKASSVPIAHQIRGMGPVEIHVSRLEKFTSVMQDLLGYAVVESDENGAVYRTDDNLVTSEIYAKLVQGDRERPGRGSVHHLAIRVDDVDALEVFHKKIADSPYHSTELVDRFYFHSLYFREANGILIEIATDGPGFTADSTVEALGKTLSLPPFLEVRRAEIEAKLHPIGD